MSFFEYVVEEWSELFVLGRISFFLVLYPVLLATVISVGLGIVLYTNQLTPPSWTKSTKNGSRESLLIVSALVLTVPSFSLLGMLQKPLGTGAVIVIVALTLYGIYPILRNVVAGLNSVDPAVLEAAKGVGMGAVRRMVRVQLPLAWPVIVSGVRVATLILVAIHVVGGLFGAPGLGDLLVDGLANFGSVGATNEVLASVVGCLVVAAVFEIVFLLVRMFTTPRGIRV